MPGRAGDSEDGSQGRVFRPPRSLTFDETRPLGYLFTGAVGASWDDRGAFAPLGLARGTVRVPPEQDVYLQVRPSMHAEHLASLRRLEPDDLQGVILFGVAVSIGDVAALMHLTGLRRLDLSFSGIDDAALPFIGPLVGLRHLYLAGTAITGDGLVHLGRLSELRRLSLTSTHVTDGGLAHLRPLSRLEWLSLNDRVTDRGLEHLAVLTRLRRLDAPARSITDAGVSWLGGLTDLRVLVLGAATGSMIGDGSALVFSRLPNLEVLDVAGSRITDDGVALIAQLDALKRLDLRRASITDASIGALTRLSSLEWLGISGTVISDAGRNALATALPACAIE